MFRYLNYASTCCVIILVSFNCIPSLCNSYKYIRNSYGRTYKAYIFLNYYHSIVNECIVIVIVNNNKIRIYINLG